VGSRAAARSNETRSVSVSLRLFLPFSLSPPVRLSLTLLAISLRNSFPSLVAPELSQTRYQFLTFARKRASSLSLSLFLLDDEDDNDDPTLVFSFSFSPVLYLLLSSFARREAAPGAIPLLSPIV